MSVISRIRGRHTRIIDSLHIPESAVAIAVCPDSLQNSTPMLPKMQTPVDFIMYGIYPSNEALCDRNVRYSVTDCMLSEYKSIRNTAQQREKTAANGGLYDFMSKPMQTEITVISMTCHTLIDRICSLLTKRARIAAV